jgi:hypothetical protein
MNFTKAERISLKRHDTLNENWVQSLIAADPSILGLGELVLRDRERVQPKAGRLDLLLQNLKRSAAMRLRSNWVRRTKPTSSERSSTGISRRNSILSTTTARF